jgi:pimeloyl-ACP methyl ester carboxylesterase
MATDTTTVFIHGLESTGQGTKGVFFRERYPDMLIEDYSGPLDQRMEKLNALLAGRKDLILVGSSFGGLMAAIFACENEDRLKKLILLAPALHFGAFKPCLGRRLSIPTVLYHGKEDDLVPIGLIREIAGRIFANLSYHLVDDDHPLHRTFPTMNWDGLLGRP